uniref:Protein kinase domain-containing protein n=1 Tax=Macrostomum lignano TaxID=282301 RepID=A0A1I8IK86_9PLAT
RIVPNQNLRYRAGQRALCHCHGSRAPIQLSPTCRIVLGAQMFLHVLLLLQLSRLGVQNLVLNNPMANSIMRYQVPKWQMQPSGHALVGTCEMRISDWGGGMKCNSATEDSVQPASAASAVASAAAAGAIVSSRIAPLDSAAAASIAAVSSHGGLPLRLLPPVPSKSRQADSQARPRCSRASAATSRSSRRPCASIASASRDFARLSITLLLGSDDPQLLVVRIAAARTLRRGRIHAGGEVEDGDGSSGQTAPRPQGSVGASLSGLPSCQQEAGQPQSCIRRPGQLQRLQIVESAAVLTVLNFGMFKQNVRPCQTVERVVQGAEARENWRRLRSNVAINASTSAGIQGAFQMSQGSVPFAGTHRGGPYASLQRERSTWRRPPTGGRSPLDGQPTAAARRREGKLLTGQHCEESRSTFLDDEAGCCWMLGPGDSIAERSAWPPDMVNEKFRFLFSGIGFCQASQQSRHADGVPPAAAASDTQRRLRRQLQMSFRRRIVAQFSSASTGRKIAIEYEPRTGGRGGQDLLGAVQGSGVVPASQHAAAAQHSEHVTVVNHSAPPCDSDRPDASAGMPRRLADPTPGEGFQSVGSVCRRCRRRRNKRLLLRRRKLQQQVDEAAVAKALAQTVQQPLAASALAAGTEQNAADVVPGLGQAQGPRRPSSSASQHRRPLLTSLSWSRILSSLLEQISREDHHADATRCRRVDDSTISRQASNSSAAGAGRSPWLTARRLLSSASQRRLSRRRLRCLLRTQTAAVGHRQSRRGPVISGGVQLLQLRDGQIAGVGYRRAVRLPRSPRLGVAQLRLVASADIVDCRRKRLCSRRRQLQQPRREQTRPTTSSRRRQNPSSYLLARRFLGPLRSSLSWSHEAPPQQQPRARCCRGAELKAGLASESMAEGYVCQLARSEVQSRTAQESLLVERRLRCVQRRGCRRLRCATGGGQAQPDCHFSVAQSVVRVARAASSAAASSFFLQLRDGQIQSLASDIAEQSACRALHVVAKVLGVADERLGEVEVLPAVLQVVLPGLVAAKAADDQIARRRPSVLQPLQTVFDKLSDEAVQLLNRDLVGIGGSGGLRRFGTTCCRVAFVGGAASGLPGAGFAAASAASIFSIVAVAGYQKVAQLADELRVASPPPPGGCLDLQRRRRRPDSAGVSEPGDYSDDLKLSSTLRRQPVGAAPAAVPPSGVRILSGVRVRQGAQQQAAAAHEASVIVVGAAARILIGRSVVAQSGEVDFNQAESSFDAERQLVVSVAIRVGAGIGIIDEDVSKHPTVERLRGDEVPAPHVRAGAGQVEIAPTQSLFRIVGFVDFRVGGV